MNSFEKDIHDFIEILNSKTSYKWNPDKVRKVAKSIIFYKYFENNLPDNHYLNSLIQDALTILDSLTHKSERYYYFILRSYIENFMRVMLSLREDDSMGIMKLIKNCQKRSNEYMIAPETFEGINNQYSECCLHVHSNIEAKTEISTYLDRIINRNDFHNEKYVEDALEKFLITLNNSITLLLITRTESIDSSFYRNKDILKMVLTEDNYFTFTKALNDEYIVLQN